MDDLDSVCEFLPLTRGKVPRDEPFCSDVAEEQAVDPKR
jgi:hypothetical protein